MMGPQPVSARHELLLLDLDGTVVDIAPSPGDVVVDRDLIGALRHLSIQDPFGLVIVTGRALDDADRMLAPLRLPTIASHGAETRVAGTAAFGTGTLPVRYIKPVIESVMAPHVRAGALIEWKPFSAAVHVRGAPHLTSSVADALAGFTEQHRTYRVQRGRHVFEILPASASKEFAVARLMQHLPYAGRRAIYIGDDVADDAAMRSIEKIGGAGLRVAGEYFAANVADFESPSAVRAWLVDRARGLPTGTAPADPRCISE